MADKTTTKARPGSALDLPMALFAAGAVAFAAYAMPADLFGSLVSAAGLPAVLPAAQPPLGGTARLAFVLGSTLVAFAAVWGLLRALGRPKKARPVAEAPVEPARLRRAGILEDTPPARAASDLAVPLGSVEVEQREAAADISEVENVDFDAVWQRPAPSFLQQPAPEVPASDDPPQTDPEPEPLQAEVPFWVPEEETASDEVEQRDGAQEVVAFWPVETAPEAAQPASAEPSLDQLANRLEGGLIRRKRDGVRRRPSPAVDDRLRGALDDLTRMSRRR